MDAMLYTELIADEKTFLSLREECERISLTSQRLPAQVFRVPFGTYYAFDHSHILSKVSPIFLERLSDFFSDVRINYMNLEPSPLEYFEWHQYYGLASFKKSELGAQYLKAMVGDPVVRADSFAVNGHRGFMWGSSLEWGICCDRKNWELCVMGTSRKVDKSIMGTLKCMDSTELASYIKNEYKWKPAVAEEFLKGFSLNYPNLDRPYGPRQHLSD